jgi:hypothetical protein
LLQYKAAAKHVVAHRLAASHCEEEIDMLPKQRGVDIDLGTKCRVIRLIREFGSRIVASPTDADRRRQVPACQSNRRGR